MALSQPSGLSSRAATVSIAAVSVVVVFKLVAAYKTGAISVLAEALQSTLDVLMSGVTLWAIRKAAQPADETHPYGHGKAELLASAFQMVLITFVALLIVFQSVQRLIDPVPLQPGWGVAAMGYALLSNALVIGYLRRTLRKVNSAALAGEVEHLRSDSLASLGVLLGLLAYQATGWGRIDPLVALACTLIGAAFAIRQLLKVLHPLMDGALDPEHLKEVDRVLREHPGVFGYHKLHSRDMGNRRVVMLHVLLEDSLSFVDAHELAELLEAQLSQALGGAFVTIHYEPRHHETERLRQRNVDQGVLFDEAQDSRTGR